MANRTYAVTYMEEFIQKGYTNFEICIHNESQRVAAECYIKNSSTPDTNAIITVCEDMSSIQTGDINNGRIIIICHYPQSSSSEGGESIV